MITGSMGQLTVNYHVININGVDFSALCLLHALSFNLIHQTYLYPSFRKLKKTSLVDSSITTEDGMSTRATWDTLFGIGIPLQHSGHIGSYQATTDQNTTSQLIDDWVGSSRGARVSSDKFSGEFLSNLCMSVPYFLSQVAF